MQAIAVTQATTIAPATSNSEDDRNIMTAHKSRNEKDERTVNTAWIPARAGILLKSEMKAAAGTTASLWMASAVGPPE